jgi:hypothetical protein
VVLEEILRNQNFMPSENGIANLKELICVEYGIYGGKE